MALPFCPSCWWWSWWMLAKTKLPSPHLSKWRPAGPLAGPQTAGQTAAKRSATPSSGGAAGGLQCDLNEQKKNKKNIFSEHLWSTCVAGKQVTDAHPRCDGVCRTACWAPAGRSVCSVWRWGSNNWTRAYQLLSLPAPPQSEKEMQSKDAFFGVLWWKSSVT